jgi:hypothetical protein
MRDLSLFSLLVFAGLTFSVRGDVRVTLTDSGGEPVEGIQVWLLTEAPDGVAYSNRGHYVKQEPLFTDAKGTVTADLEVPESSSLRVVVVDPEVEPVDEHYPPEQAAGVNIPVQRTRFHGALALDLSSVEDTHPFKERWIKLPEEKWMISLRMRNREGDLVMSIAKFHEGSLGIYGLLDGDYTLELVVFTKYRSGSGFLYPADAETASLRILDGELSGPTSLLILAAEPFTR